MISLKINKILLIIGIIVLIYAFLITIGFVVLVVNNAATDGTFIRVMLSYAVGITLVIISRVVKK